MGCFFRGAAPGSKPANVSASWTLPSLQISGDSDTAAILVSVKRHEKACKLSGFGPDILWPTLRFLSGACVAAGGVAAARSRKATTRAMPSQVLSFDLFV